MINEAILIFGIGMVAGMCLTIVFLAVAIVLLILHDKVENEEQPEGDVPD